MYVALIMIVFGTPCRQCRESIFLALTFNTAHLTSSHSLELGIRCNLLRGFLLYNHLPFNAYLVLPISSCDVLPDAVNLPSTILESLRMKKPNSLFKLKCRRFANKLGYKTWEEQHGTIFGMHTSE